MRNQVLSAAAIGVPANFVTCATAQEKLPPDDPRIAVAEEEDGRYYTEDGIPTFQIDDDMTVDWFTYSGYRRYHSECHVCHGPDGEGRHMLRR